MMLHPAVKDPYADHERELAEAMEAYLACTDETERVHLWARYQELHAKRSPEKVGQMEREKGLL